MAAYDGSVSLFEFTTYSSTVGSLGGAWAGGFGPNTVNYLMSQASDAAAGFTVWISRNADTSDRPVGPTYSGSCWIATVLR